MVTEPFDDMPAARAAAKRLLADSAQRLKDGGIGPALEEQMLAGDPADQILTYAAQAAADLIVVGHRGLNAVQRFLVGSVSTKIMTHAPCAVLVVPQARHLNDGNSTAGGPARTSTGQLTSSLGSASAPYAPPSPRLEEAGDVQLMGSIRARPGEQILVQRGIER